MPKQFDLVVVGGGLARGDSRQMHGRAWSQCDGSRARESIQGSRPRGVPGSVGVAEARKLGIDGLLRKRCALEVPWVDFFAGNMLTAHRNVAATTPHQLPCLAFYHPAMQEALFNAAARAGAEVRRAMAVEAVRPGTPAAVVVGNNGNREEIRARLVVGADGRSSSVRVSAGFKIRRNPDLMLVAGVLMENAPEDTGQIIINSSLGQVATFFPLGGKRARVYLCYQAGTQPRHQSASDIPRFIEGCKAAGVNAACFEGASAAGPIATFDGAETWVEHPYREGVALVGHAAAASDPSWGQGLALTLRDVRVLRDQLLRTKDWEAAGHAYATEHDLHSSVMRTALGWYTEFYLTTGPAAGARRARALPLIAEDPTRQPDSLFCGPDQPLSEADRKRVFAEE